MIFKLRAQEQLGQEEAGELVHAPYQGGNIIMWWRTGRGRSAFPQFVDAPIRRFVPAALLGAIALGALPNTAQAQINTSCESLLSFTFPDATITGAPQA